MARRDALSGSSRSSVFKPFCNTYKENSRSIMSGGERYYNAHTDFSATRVELQYIVTEVL